MIHPNEGAATVPTNEATIPDYDELCHRAADAIGESIYDAIYQGHWETVDPMVEKYLAIREAIRSLDASV